MDEKKSKILVVEDSNTMRHLIRFALLKLHNSDIIEAIDGSDAIKKLRQYDFDLVITDIIMPNVDGFKLIQFIRKQEDYKNTPIIIVSTKYSSEARDRGFSLGANAYISKPLQSGTLLQTVEKLLRNHSLNHINNSVHREK